MTVKRFRLLGLLFLFAICPLLEAEEIIGFWKTVDEHTSKVQSVVAIYQYQGKYYGRIIATYDQSGKMADSIYAPKERAPGVKGHPYYAGLDIIYDIQKEGDRYKEGKIIDPEQGKEYDAELWLQDGNLIVRGEILVFGRNQTWPPAQESDFPPDFKKPDLTQLVPRIPQLLSGT
jgi:uncharacterized protein (DUF2147 family)